MRNKQFTIYIFYQIKQYFLIEIFLYSYELESLKNTFYDGWNKRNSDGSIVNGIKENGFEDVIYGTGKDDEILGLAGGDAIDGMAGNDVILGGDCLL